MTRAVFVRGPADGLAGDIGPILPDHLRVKVGARDAHIITDPAATTTADVDHYELVNHIPDGPRSVATYAWTPPA